MQHDTRFPKTNQHRKRGRASPCYQEVIPERAVSGSVFQELPLEKWPPTNRDEMPPLLMYWASLKAVYGGLKTRLNAVSSMMTIAAAALSLPACDKPTWHPEYFNLKSAAEAQFFQKIFREFLMLITVFNKLKRLYGGDVADRVTGRMAIPMAVPYLRQAFHPVENLDDIHPILQQLSNYLKAHIGEDKAFEGHAFISEDRTELRLFVTKCAYIQVLRAYGLRAFAAKTCLADHVVFDTALPNLVFSRKHAIGVGDLFCDHVMRLPLPGDREKDSTRYEDCYKIPDGMEEVLRWEKVLAEHRRK